jgi:hypothetical protein
MTFPDWIGLFGVGAIIVGFLTFLAVLLNGSSDRDYGLMQSLAENPAAEGRWIERWGRTDSSIGWPGITHLISLLKANNSTDLTNSQTMPSRRSTRVATQPAPDYSYQKFRKTIETATEKKTGWSVRSVLNMGTRSMIDRFTRYQVRWSKWIRSTQSLCTKARCNTQTQNGTKNSTNNHNSIAQTTHMPPNLNPRMHKDLQSKTPFVNLSEQIYSYLEGGTCLVEPRDIVQFEGTQEFKRLLQTFQKEDVSTKKYLEHRDAWANVE